jgi:hypothetical protein
MDSRLDVLGLLDEIVEIAHGHILALSVRSPSRQWRSKDPAGPDQVSRSSSSLVSSSGRLLGTMCVVASSR